LKKIEYKYKVIIYDLEDKDEWEYYINDLEELKNIRLSIRRQEIKDVIKLE
jgi:hypothetical protein